MRKLLRVDVAIDVVGLDHPDRLLQLRGVDLAGGVVGHVWQGVGERLVRVDTQAESEAETNHTDDQHGNAPEDVASHVSRLTKSRRPDRQQPSQMQGFLG
jgi:hypothetical protein